jgi:quinol monooxygenase YgiN
MPSDPDQLPAVEDAMSTHVVNEFHALPDRADDVMNLLIELSPISRTRPGCHAISLRRNQDDPTNIVGDTRWATRQDYDNKRLHPHRTFDAEQVVLNEKVPDVRRFCRAL